MKVRIFYDDAGTELAENIKKKLRALSYTVEKVSSDSFDAIGEALLLDSLSGVHRVIIVLSDTFIKSVYFPQLYRFCQDLPGITYGVEEKATYFLIKDEKSLSFGTLPKDIREHTYIELTTTIDEVCGLMDRSNFYGEFVKTQRYSNRKQIPPLICVNQEPLILFNQEPSYSPHKFQGVQDSLLLKNEISYNQSHSLKQPTQSFEIDKSQLTVNKEQVLGKGSFGKVYGGTYYRLPAAIKKLKNTSPRALEDFQHEIQTLMKLRHDNIVSCFGCVTGTEPLIVMELMSKGSLYEYIFQQQYPFNTAEIIKFLTQISLGMHYLHAQSPKIIHRDLKSLNVLLDSNLVAKISDFGLAKTKEHSKTQTATEIIGTVPWAAPEYLTFSRLKERNEKGDVFSFGVIVWELVTQQVPWKSTGMSSRDIEQAVVKGNRLDIPKECPAQLKNLMQSCWKNDPNSRPSFEDIVSFLQSMNSDDMQLSYLKKKLAQLKY